MDLERNGMRVDGMSRHVALLCRTFKNFSTVLDLPVVIITSLEWICSKACIAILSALDSSSVISSLIASITVV